MDWIKIFESKTSTEVALKENRPRLLVVRGKKICLVRREGKLYGVQDKCNHSGESLSKGNINYLGEVVCPLHHYQFNLKTGRESAQRCHDLECFPVKETEEGIFIGL